MAYLWSTDCEASPAEVHQAVAPELAYTTIMTILTRLWEKGRLTRGQRGRAYTYEPVSVGGRASSCRTAAHPA